MTIKWTEIYKNYKGKWVALNNNETTVIGIGKTAKEAYEKAIKKGHASPILTRVPKKFESYVGTF